MTYSGSSTSNRKQQTWLSPCVNFAPNAIQNLRWLNWSACFANLSWKCQSNNFSLLNCCREFTKFVWFLENLATLLDLLCWQGRFHKIGQIGTPWEGHEGRPCEPSHPDYWTRKVCGIYVVTLLNWTPIFERCMVRFAVENRCYMCSDEVGACAQHIDTILDSIYRYHI